MLDFSDRTRTGISKLISRCALQLPSITCINLIPIDTANEGLVENEPGSIQLVLVQLLLVLPLLVIVVHFITAVSIHIVTNGGDCPHLFCLLLLLISFVPIFFEQQSLRQ